VHAYPSKKHLSNHKSKSLNVACDFWGYKPIELETVKELVNLNEEFTD
jgi:calcineurin-like phosphoesterase family protein